MAHAQVEFILERDAMTAVAEQEKADCNGLTTSVRKLLVDAMMQAGEQDVVLDVNQSWNGLIASDETRKSSSKAWAHEKFETMVRLVGMLEALEQNFRC